MTPHADHASFETRPAGAPPDEDFGGTTTSPHPEEAAKRPSRRTHDGDPTSWSANEKGAYASACAPEVGSQTLLFCGTVRLLPRSSAIGPIAGVVAAVVVPAHPRAGHVVVVTPAVRALLAAAIARDGTAGVDVADRLRIAHHAPVALAIEPVVPGR